MASSIPTEKIVLVVEHKVLKMVEREISKGVFNRRSVRRGLVKAHKVIVS